MSTVESRQARPLPTVVAADSIARMQPFIIPEQGGLQDQDFVEISRDLYGGDMAPGIAAASIVGHHQRSIAGPIHEAAGSIYIGHEDLKRFDGVMNPRVGDEGYGASRKERVQAGLRAIQPPALYEIQEEDTFGADENDLTVVVGPVEPDTLAQHLLRLSEHDDPASQDVTSGTIGKAYRVLESAADMAMRELVISDVDMHSKSLSEILQAMMTAGINLLSFTNFAMRANRLARTQALTGRANEAELMVVSGDYVVSPSEKTVRATQLAYISRLSIGSLMRMNDFYATKTTPLKAFLDGYIAQ